MGIIRENPNIAQQLSGARVRDRSSGKLTQLEAVQQNSKQKEGERSNAEKRTAEPTQNLLKSLLSTRPGIEKVKFYKDRQKEGRE